MNAQRDEVLAQLREVASARREARRRIADLTTEHGRGSSGHEAAWTAYRAVTNRWSALIRQAAHERHPLADVARAAGCARSSLYRHLRAVPAEGTALGMPSDLDRGDE